MNPIVNFAARFSVPVVLILALLTVVFGLQLPKLQLHASFEKMMLHGESSRQAFDDFKQVFGEQEQLLIYLSDKQILQAEKLKSIEYLLQQLKALPFVTSSTSLFSLKDTKVLSNGEVVSPTYLDGSKPFESEEKRQQWLKRMRQDPIVSEQFIAKDGQAMAIILSLQSGKGGAARDATIVSEIEKTLQPIRKELSSVFQIGSADVRHSVNNKVLQDQKLILPMALAALLVMLALIMRRLNGALVPLFTGTMSIVWTLGAMAWLGVELNVLTAVAPILIIIVGSTEDIHLLSEYYAGRQEGLDHKKTLERLANKVGIAVLLTFMTTALGFFSIAANPIKILQEFGLVTGFGLAVNFLITILFVPAWLTLFPGKDKVRKDASTDLNWLERALIKVMGWVLKSKRTLVVMVLLVVVVSVIGTLQVKVDNNPLRFFNQDDAVLVNHRTLDEGLSGSHDFSIVIDGEIKGTFLQVSYLEQLSEIQQFLKKSGLFRKSLSFADIIAKTNVVMQEDDSGELYLPEDDDMVREYILMLDEKQIGAYISSDFSSARISVRHSIEGSHELGLAIQQVEDYLSKNLPKGLDYAITGHEIMTKHAADYMAVGQIISLSIVFVIIWMLVAGLFVNHRAGLLALAPNIIPLITLFGIMGWLDIPLDTSTAMVAAIALGICIDDTLHFMVRFHQSNRGKADHMHALEETVRHEAAPIFSTSLALASGFALLGLSGFPPIANFGLLSAAVIFMALISTFLILPMLLASIRLVSLWDMLDLKVREKVLIHCALFANMRNWHIKKLILMSEVKTYQKGESLFEQGESGNEMYVVLSGEIEIDQDNESGHKVLNQLSDGDILGEMALLRETTRSASAVAAEDAQVMVLRWDDIKRIHRTYPNISSRFFMNISMVLSNRLVSLSER